MQEYPGNFSHISKWGSFNIFHFRLNYLLSLSGVGLSKDFNDFQRAFLTNWKSSLFFPNSYQNYQKRIQERKMFFIKCVVMLTKIIISGLFVEEGEWRNKYINSVFLTRHTYWLCGPGEKVLERMIVLPLTKGVCKGLGVLLSFGRTTREDCIRLSVLVSLSTWKWKIYQCSFPSWYTFSLTALL